MPLQPGDRFGRYEITELLGKGGMGEVYRAQDTLLRRRVALKVLHAQVPAPGDGAGTGPDQTDGAARILREARAAAGIEHPNAISIYDVGEVDGLPFLAMEYVPGKTLRPFIGDETVSLTRRIRWLIDIARALGAAHALGLVHRDIKPENVMVRDDGVVKVLDFGIARRQATKVDPNAATEGAGLGTLTGEGLVVGTPFYMSPEQMRGETLDGRADQFAWGALAYELLTGTLPWDRASDGLQLVAQILSGEVQPPRARNAEIPPAVEGAILRALSKSASQRFAQMEDAAAALEPHAAAIGVATGRSEMRRSVPGGETPRVPMEASPVVEARRAPERPARGGWLVLPVLALVVVGAGWLARVAPHAPTTTSSPDASAAVEVETRMSPNAEATAAYRAGMQALKDASMQSAKEQLDRAIQLDSLFAAARLRRALLTDEVITAEARQDLQGARSARESLGTRDRILLDAMEPWTRVPPDLRESQRRLEAAVKQYPDSADFAFHLGWTLHNAYESRLAAAAFDAALANDPTFAMAWCMTARERVNLDDLAGAADAYAQCLSVSPGGTSCLEDLSTLQGSQGECEDMAGTSRRLIAVAPDDAAAYGQLAQALYSLGEPIDSVRAALEQKWTRLPAPRRRNVQLLDEASFAVLTGRFDEAEQRDRSYEQATASSSQDTTHFVPAFDRMLLALEEGRNAEAVRLGNDYLDRRPAWQTEEMALEPTISVRGVQAMAGGVTKPDLDKARAQWLGRNQERIARVGFVAAAYAGTTWIFADAFAVTTPEEAAVAMASRPDVHPLVDALTASPSVDEPVGRTYFLAGHIDDAVTVLTRATRSCDVLDAWAPIFSTWAAFELGEALEARGDGVGACAAYRRVLDRWGRATPGSRTASKARARVKALRCER